MLNVLENGERSRNIVVSKKRVDCVPVHFHRHAECQQRLDLRSEQQTSSVVVDIERLLAQAIAIDRQHLFTAIKHRDREHSVELIDKSASISFEQSQ